MYPGENTTDSVGYPNTPYKKKGQVTYQPGDIIICIKADEPESEWFALKEGKEYTVRSMMGPGKVCLEDDGYRDNVYDTTHFRPHASKDSSNIFIPSKDELTGIDSSKEKVKMNEARVFYVNVGSIPPAEVKVYLDGFIELMEEGYDISEVVFMPTRTKESGWQYPSHKE
jgi:hypothetical protein